MEFSGQSEEPIAPEQNNINASLPGSSTSNPPGIVFVPQEQQNIQQALSDINKHMGNMAALLPQLARPSSSGTNESHDDIDNDPDDKLPPAKKIRKDSEFCESDSVSIHADDEDDHSLDGEKKALLEESQQLDDEDERDHGDEAFLDTLAESLDNADAVTDIVKPQLAHIANKRWGKRLTPDKLKPMIDKHKQPANCSDVVNSRVNPEIWGQLNAAKKSTDLRLANMQQAIQKVAFITLQTADSLLTVTSGKDPDKADLNKLVSNAVDSIALLGHVTNDLNNFRREQIRPALNPEFAVLCSAEIPHGKWLFGEDLPKRIRDIKETSKLGQVVAGPSRKRNFRNDRQAMTGKYFPRNPSSRKDFLWKGQQRPPTKKKQPFRQERKF